MTFFYHQDVNFNFTLAPMVGLSHVALRALIQDYMPEGATTWWPTEMLNTRRLPGQEFEKSPFTIKGQRDVTLVPQILGNQERPIAESVKKLEDYGAIGIDINMGCPVRKALKHNYGVSLMGDPDYAKSVVAMTVKHASVPVSVKLRVGESGEEENFLKFTTGLVEAGAKYLCLHPRTQKQKRRGNADWDQIKKLRDHVNVPIIGNGDIQTVDDVFSMLEQTHCDGVMIGRALTARPWMMWQIGERLGLPAPEKFKGLKAPSSLEEEAYEYGQSLERFVHYCFLFFEEKDAFKRIYFYLRVSSVWLNFGHGLNKRVVAAKTKEELVLAIQRFFKTPGLCFTDYTLLRY